MYILCSKSATTFDFFFKLVNAFSVTVSTLHIFLEQTALAFYRCVSLYLYYMFFGNNVIFFVVLNYFF